MYGTHAQATYIHTLERFFFYYCPDQLRGLQFIGSYDLTRFGFIKAQRVSLKVVVTFVHCLSRPKTLKVALNQLNTAIQIYLHSMVVVMQKQM